MPVIPALALAIAHAPSHAQVPDSTSTFIVDAYEPGSLWGLDVLNAQRTRVPAHLGVVFGLELGWVDTPLELAVEGAPRDVTAELVSHRLRGDVGVGVGLFDRFAVALSFPLAFTQGGDDLALLGRPGDVVAGAAPGDLRVSLRATILEVQGFGVGAALDVALPTGADDAFMSYGGVRLRPTLLFDWHDRASGLGIVANVGWHLVPETVAHNLVVDDGMTWAFGLDLPTPAAGLDVEVSLFGTAPLSDDRDPATGAAQTPSHAAPIELVGALSADVGDIVIEVGAGAGLSRGIGAPAWRALASVAWAPIAPVVVDSDRDGLPDTDDVCPRDPEDKDGFEDGDGCPDVDDDQDGVRDVDDRCPRVPEDPDGHADEDGCPDPDNDGDGLSDTADACPDEREDKDGFADEDGCLDPDNDKDGVLDAIDGPPDGRGLGSCRDAPETKNGYRDEDGCPDDAPKSVRVTKTRIEILEKVYFDFNKATIKPVSFDLLDEVARVLREAPELTKVRVEGHTDHAGDADYNDRLSQARAEAVMAHLVGRGIDPARLVAQGWGERKPIVLGAAGKRPAGMAMNRRVEFIIVEVDGRPQDPEAPVIIERPTPVP